MLGFFKIKCVKTFLLLAVVFCPFILTAQETAPQAHIHALVIDRNFIFLNSLMGKEIQNRGKAELDALLKEDEMQTEELQAREKELAQQRSEMNSEGFAILVEEFSQRVEKTRADFLAKDQLRLQMATIWRQRFDDIVVRASSAIAKQNGANMIVDSETVIWHDQSIDISQVLTAILDEEYLKNTNLYNDILFAPIETDETDATSDEVPQLENENNEDISNDTNQ